MKLYFLRHGQSEYNSIGILAGQLDVGLTKLGRDQAKLAGQDILEQRIPIDLIVSSKLIRAYDTAVEIAKALNYPIDEIYQTDLVTERDFGSLQGTASKKITEAILESSNAESDEQLRLRAAKFVDWARTCNVDSMVVVSHNDFGRRLKAVLNDVDTSFVDPAFPNAEMINFGEIGAKKLKRNDHIPADILN